MSTSGGSVGGASSVGGPAISHRGAGGVRHTSRHDESRTPSGSRTAVERRLAAGRRRGTGGFYPTCASTRASPGSVKLVPMLVTLLDRMRLRGAYLHLASLGAVLLCINLWIRAKTI